MNLNEIKKAHFIGVGGISMSAIADALLDRGIAVSGSDKKKSEKTEKLQAKGADIHYNHDARNVDSPDVLVYTGAIEAGNPEFKYAMDNGINILRRTQMLNFFLEEHKYNIAISGTHGKTTTSGMTTALLESAGLKPDFLIGATVPMFSSAHRLDNSEYLVLEACEYQANFLDFEPNTILINNIDYDHVDYYTDINHVVSTFEKFADKVAGDGKLIINNDDEHLLKFKSKYKSAYTYGIENESNFMAKNIRLNSDKTQSYDFYVDGENLGEFKLSVFGNQNVYNSLGALACCLVNGIDFELIKHGLVDYHNALRRFEKLYTKGDALLISDYAHHPTEIEATIKAARGVHENRLVVIFQPHTYTRTKELLSEWSTSFEGADEVYIVDIDPIREDDIYNISSDDLVHEIKKHSDVSVSYIGSAENIEKYIREELVDDNIVIAMGAGEIDAYAREYVRKEK